MSYRMDSRTKEQFIDDIEKGNARERLAIILFKNYLERELGFKGEIRENGCDMSGKFIEDDSVISCEADYMIGSNPLEVKTSACHRQFIFLKAKQIDSYIKQGASLLFVSGIELDRPAFTFFTVEELEQIRSTYKPVKPFGNINGGKLSYKLKTSQFEWLYFGGGVFLYEG